MIAGEGKLPENSGGFAAAPWPAWLAGWAIPTRWKLATAGVLLFYGGSVIGRLVALPINHDLEDFKFFLEGAQELSTGTDPYTYFLSHCHVGWCLGGYIYPPTLALAIRPLLAMPSDVSAGLWFGLTQLAILAAIWVTYRTIGGWISNRAALALLLALLAFQPLYKQNLLLQVGPVMLLVFALAARSYIRNPGGAGVGAWLGIGALIKLTPALMLPALVRGRRDLRRPWGVLALGVVVLASAVIFWIWVPPTQEYLTRVLPQLNVGTSEPDNQSAPALLLRVQDVVLHQRYLALALLSDLVVGVVLLVTWVRSLEIGGARGRAAVFAAFLAAIPVVSAITWDHHLLTELLVIALLAPSLRRGQRAWWMVVVGYALIWLSHYEVVGLASTLGLVDVQLKAHLIDLPPSIGWQLAPWLVLISVNTWGICLIWLASLEVLRGLRLSQRQAGAVEVQAPVGAIEVQA